VSKTGAIPEDLGNAYPKTSDERRDKLQAIHEQLTD